MTSRPIVITLSLLLAKGNLSLRAQYSLPKVGLQKRS
jgi:hypothetical protein